MQVIVIFSFLNVTTSVTFSKCEFVLTFFGGKFELKGHQLFIYICIQQVS